MSEIKKYLIVTSMLLMFLGISHGVKAQRFGGAVVFGFNASQIDGDLLAGYNKLGLSGGLKLDYKLQDPWFLSMELLYSQRGSQSELLADASIPIRKINLQYIELPLMIRYKDWWVESDDYFKADAEFGLSYGYLFNASKSEGSFTFDTDEFQQHDLGFTLGASYFVTKHWGFNVRYTRSLTRLHKNPDTNEKGLLGYFLSFRVQYQF